jgi:hypothetical protein
MIAAAIAVAIVVAAVRTTAATATFSTRAVTGLIT